MKRKKHNHDGVKTNPDKVEQLPAGVLEYRKIQAFQCCDFDGKNAGYTAGTPDGDRWLVEKRFIPTDKSQSIWFKNCW
jgi:hypothetical protein